jgi:co-chaperonin GroES (HSP10)
MFLTFVFLLCLFITGTSFLVRPSSCCVGREAVKLKVSSLVFKRRKSTNAVASSHSVGENLPEEIKKCKAINDMILVERLAQPQQTASGIFLPRTEGKDKMHLGKVLSIPDQCFTEEGKSVRVKDMFPFMVGDTVFIQV